MKHPSDKPEEREEFMKEMGMSIVCTKMCGMDGSDGIYWGKHSSHGTAQGDIIMAIRRKQSFHIHFQKK